mgnify:CR=1 FL=1
MAESPDTAPNDEYVKRLEQLVARLHQSIHALYQGTPEAQEQYRKMVEEVLRGPR